MDPGQWPGDPATRAAIQADWDPLHGDRRQKIVFIGVEMDEAGLRRRLDACLLTPEEVGLALEDPFPPWRLETGETAPEAG